MDSALPPLKRFRLKHEGNPLGTTDTLPTKPTLPEKKRTEASVDYWLPDLNLPASSCCLPAKKRVWALPPVTPAKSSDVSSFQNDHRKEEKASPVWTVKKKRTEKAVKRSQEKLDHKPVKELPQVDELTKAKQKVDGPEEEEDPNPRNKEVQQTEQIAKEQEPLAKETEAVVALQEDDPLAKEVPLVDVALQADGSLAMKVPLEEEHMAEELKPAEQPMAEEMPLAEVYPVEQSMEDLIAEDSEDEEPQIVGQRKYKGLNAEESAKEELMTESPCEAAEEAGEEEDDDGVICAVCRSTDGDASDPIVFCDGCDLMVHASCYGNPLSVSIPEGDWFCARCLASSKAEDGQGRGSSGRSCCLCPTEGGVTKPTTDGRWAHVLCALLVPEVFFHDPAGRDGVDLSRVPARRWERRCCVCRKAREGCVVDCSEHRCGLAFHVSCAMDADLCVEYRPGKAGDIVVGFCQQHTEAWRKQESTGKFKFVPRT